jgi:hypothetical protein
MVIVPGLAGMTRLVPASSAPAAVTLYFCGPLKVKTPSLASNAPVPRRYQAFAGSIGYKLRV